MKISFDNYIKGNLIKNLKPFFPLNEADNIENKIKEINEKNDSEKKKIVNLISFFNYHTELAYLDIENALKETIFTKNYLSLYCFLISFSILMYNLITLNNSPHLGILLALNIILLIVVSISTTQIIIAYKIQKYSDLNSGIAYFFRYFNTVSDMDKKTIRKLINITKEDSEAVHSLMKLTDYTIKLKEELKNEEVIYPTEIEEIYDTHLKKITDFDMIESYLSILVERDLKLKQVKDSSLQGNEVASKIEIAYIYLLGSLKLVSNAYSNKYFNDNYVKQILLKYQTTIESFIFNSNLVSVNDIISSKEIIDSLSYLSKEIYTDLAVCEDINKVNIDKVTSNIVSDIEQLKIINGTVK